MLSSGLRRGTLTAWTALIIAAGVSACGDDGLLPEPTGPGTLVDHIRLNTPLQTLTLFRDGRLTLGPLTFDRPDETLQMTMHDAAGNVLPADPDQLWIKIASDNTQCSNTTTHSGIRYVPAGGFSGTLTGCVQPGATSLRVLLFDQVSRKIVFGPYAVPIRSR